MTFLFIAKSLATEILQDQLTHEVEVLTLSDVCFCNTFLRVMLSAFSDDMDEPFIMKKDCVLTISFLGRYFVRTLSLLSQAQASFKIVTKNIANMHRVHDVSAQSVRKPVHCRAGVEESTFSNFYSVCVMAQV